MFRRFFFSLIFLFFLFVFSIRNVSAKDFSSFYKTSYEFNTKGEALVSQEISLINEVADLYISEYNLSIVGGEVTKIEAYDKVGQLKINSFVKDSTTIINLRFNEKVVGKGKVLSFILKYKVLGFAEKEGNLWQISLPKLANAEEIDDYQLLLKIPTSFGKISYLNPNPKSEEESGDIHFLTFDKQDLLKYGVLVSLGQYQTFDFQLFYELNNDSSTEKLFKIALIPDTSYQTVTYLSFNHEPFDVEVDDDGNWLALYLLFSRQKIKVETTGSVNVFSQVKKNFPKRTFSKSEYLKPHKYWQVEDEKIRKIAEKLKTPDKIYHFVVNNLQYDYQAASGNPARRGALEALDNPQQSLCTEFADLFVALCRAAGIPARELEGYAYTDNPRLKEISLRSDLLHSWPEYYDDEKKEWIMVDPTWGHTTGGLDYFNKLDMTRIVFAIHGKDDIFPLPVGSYKEKDYSERQVFITFGKELKKTNIPILKIEEVNPFQIYSGRNNLVRSVLKNQSGWALYDKKIQALTKSEISPDKLSIDLLPPYGRLKYNFLLKPEEILKDYRLDFTYKFEETELPLIFTVKSLALRVIIIGGAILTIFLTIILIKIKKKLPPNYN